MRALHFMKIDYILTRKQMYVLPLLCVVAAAMGMGVGENAVLMSCSYLSFIGSVFATTPFGICGRSNAGFLLLLPASSRDRVAGRFLYGLSFIGIDTLLTGILLGVFRFLEYEETLWTVAACLFCLTVCILILTVEYLLLYLLGEGKSSGQYLGNLIRVVPGMGMFFLFSFLVEKTEVSLGEAGSSDLAVKFVWAGVLAIAAALVLMGAVAAVCARVIEKRDYA